MKLHLPYKLLLVSVVLSGIALFAAQPTISTPIRFIGLSLAVLSFLLGLWAKNTIRSHGTTLNPSGQPTALVTNGPFRLSRNPMYFSYAVAAFGMALFSGSPFSLITPFLYFLYLNYAVIPREERRMNMMFGPRFQEYALATRRWI
jgi:protein-S-isoprenylcysteine O-methyltransferase Ste14